MSGPAIDSGGVGSLGHRYRIPVLLTEVSPAEGLMQACDALQQLDHIINDVFGRIQKRINDEKTKIASVVERVGKAQEKVTQIGANPNRVTTIFSTAKYPAPKVLPDFARVLDVKLDPSNGAALPPTENRGMFLPCRREEHKLASHLRFQRAPPADTSALFSTLVNQRLQRTEALTGDEEQEMAEGLGRLPAYLPSISSVLLFNSDENPYKQYVSINNLEGVGGEDRQQALGGPSAAPQSLIEGLALPTFSGFTFEYKPLLGEMPTFDLPSNLPLGKLADISFGVDQNQSIAPSLAQLQLPNLDQLSLPTPSRPQQSAVPQNTAASAATSTTAAPAAPPMSAPSVPVAPPPPAAPAAPPAPAGPPSAAPSNVPAAVAKPAGGRAALLDSIRVGKRLRKVGSGPPGAGRPTGGKIMPKGGSKGGEDAAGGSDKPGRSTVDVPGGDMMAALRERMARRQQVMSGKADVEASKSNAPAGGPPPRRMSVAPRLQKPPSLLRPPGAATNGDKSGEGDENGAGGESKMSSAVLSAYVNAHAKKQENEDDWE